MTDEERMAFYEIIEKQQRKRLFRKYLGWMILFFLMSLILFLTEGRCEEKKKADWGYRAAIMVNAGGTLADWISSDPSPGTREANVNMPSNRYTQAAVMTATSGFVAVLCHMAYKQGHRKAAIWGNIAMGVAHGSAAGWNFSLNVRLK